MAALEISPIFASRRVIIERLPSYGDCIGTARQPDGQAPT
jgi:hypothetical protein